MDNPILIKLYTVTVYDLRMCMKEDNTGPKKLWEINICASVCDIEKWNSFSLISLGSSNLETKHT